MVQEASGTRRSVLISGAGIAGCTLAYWLARRGMRVTVVERSLAQRSSGAPVDVRGPAADVADRMGITRELRQHQTDVSAMRFVTAQGVPAGHVEVAALRRSDDPFIQAVESRWPRSSSGTTQFATSTTVIVASTSRSSPACMAATAGTFRHSLKRPGPRPATCISMPCRASMCRLDAKATEYGARSVRARAANAAGARRAQPRAPVAAAGRAHLGSPSSHSPSVTERAAGRHERKSSGMSHRDGLSRLTIGD
jgi:FAD dependent oxidoreductase